MNIEQITFPEIWDESVALRLAFNDSMDLILSDLKRVVPVPYGRNVRV